MTVHLSACPPPRTSSRCPAVAGEQDWDANWLMIRGDIRTAGGRRWEFLDPCLTTWEVRDLSAWLRRAAVSGGAARRRRIAFTEPNLTFSFRRRRAGRACLEACFSHEALPPWAARDHDGRQTGKYALTLDISREYLIHAARAWDLEHEQFPER